MAGRVQETSYDKPVDLTVDDLTWQTELPSDGSATPDGVIRITPQEVSATSQSEH